VTVESIDHVGGLRQVDLKYLDSQLRTMQGALLDG
jgi:hypothetical protein